MEPEIGGFDWESVQVDRTKFHDFKRNGPESTVKLMKSMGILPYPVRKEEKKDPVGINLVKILPKPQVIRLEDFN